jgi:DnaA family protein
MTGSTQIPLPMRREDLATWENWLSRSGTQALENWLVAESEAHQSAYLWGKASVGKSHVLQACCDKRGSDARYLPLRDLLLFPPEQVLLRVEEASLIAIDDIDAIELETHWHEPLFALFNRSQERGCCLVVAARQAPQRLLHLLPDLRSRLGSLPVFHLPSFSEDHIAALLTLKARSAGLQVSAEVGRYCALRLPRDPSAAIAFIEALDQRSLAQSRAITIPFVRESGLLITPAAQ